MKKFVGILLACVMCFSAVFCVSANAAQVKKGDVDHNGHINVKDATLIEKYVVGAISLDDEAFEAADVDSNNKISIVDATYVTRYIVCLITEFPDKSATQPSTEKTSLSTDKEGYYNVVVKP